MEKEIQIIEQEYLLELQKIRNTIKRNQNKAIVAVNSAAIINNYEIGTIINERKVWTNKYIERLANDLKHFISGYSFRTLKYMSQFDDSLSYSGIRQQGVAQTTMKNSYSKIGVSKYKFIEELPKYLEKKLNSKDHSY